LISPSVVVQWPIGTQDVTLWSDGTPYRTKVHDPAIQDFEIMAAWDAEYHIPQRLTADFGAEEAAWHVGGRVWRQRRVREERALRFQRNPSQNSSS
jgi:hypothetical protein